MSYLTLTNPLECELSISIDGRAYQFVLNPGETKRLELTTESHTFAVSGSCIEELSETLVLPPGEVSLEELLQ
jgi:hypothetical protein